MTKKQATHTLSTHSNEDKGNGRLSVTVGRPGRRVNAQQAEDLTGEDVKGGGHHEGGDDRIGEQNGENAQSEGANGELMMFAKKIEKQIRTFVQKIKNFQFLSSLT